MGLIQKKINQFFIRQAFNQFRKRAARLLSRPEQSARVLQEAAAKGERARGPVERLSRDLGLLVWIVRDWVRGEYRVVPAGSIVMILAALLYWISPLDAVSDLVPGLGYVDDAFILGWVIGQVRADLHRYRIWRETRTA